MSKISKFSTVTLAVATGVWLSGVAMFVPVAQAQGLDLQAQINLLLEQVKDLQLQLAAQGGSPALVATTFTQNLTLGSTGAEVKALQQFLNGSGFPVSASGAGSPGNESTYFGAKTQAALAKYQAAKGITPSVGYFGPKTRQYVNSFVVVTPPPCTTPGCITPPPVVPGTGLAISTAFDTPASATVPKGAYGVRFAKFTITGSGTLNSLIFKRGGIGASTDIGSGGVYLYEGDARLTNGKSVNSTTNEVTFVNLNLAVSGSRTFTLVADIAGAAATGDVHNFALTSSAGSVTTVGTFTSNSMTIGGVVAGGVSANDQNSPANPKIGQQKAPLIEILLSASSTEDVTIDRIALTQGGTITNSNLSNFVLEQNGVKVASAQSIGAKDIVTLVFTTPFKIEKGQNKAFILYGDISGGAKSGDTIIFYLDSNADVHGVGGTYGYTISTLISNMNSTSNSTTLTLQGGDITITFNGPIVGNVPLRGNDVELFNFTIASVNNIEIKNLRLNASLAVAPNGSQGFNDFKLWDVGSSAVISSATDVTTSSNVTVTDVININAGLTKRFKVTADVDPDNTSTSTIRVALLAWQGSDIRNLDNNTYVATSTIVPSGQVTGNIQTTVTPGLEVQLSGAQGSQSVVRGTDGVTFVALSLRALNDDVRITSFKVSASVTAGGVAGGVSTGTLATAIADLQSVALYDGTNKISESKTLTGSALPATATFSSLNYIIKKGETKIITVKGNLPSAATNQAQYFVYLAATTDISAVDTQSNTITLTGSTANSGASVVATVLSSGDVVASLATSDNEHKARLVVAGGTEVLGKYKFTAVNEAMTINNLSFLVSTSSATTTPSSNNTEVPNEVQLIKLYDGATGAVVGDPAGYSLVGSGASSGIAMAQNVNWNLGKNEERILVVKGKLGTIDPNSSNQAKSGTSLYLALLNNGFKATGATAIDESISSNSTDAGVGGVTSTEKLVVYGKPTVTVQSLPTASLTNLNPVIARVRVAAGATSVAFKTLSFNVTLSLATSPAPTTSNITVYNITKAPNTALSLATVVSGGGTASSGSVGLPIGTTGANAGIVTIFLTTSEELAANTYSDYDVYLTLTSYSGTAGVANITTKLSLPETSGAGVAAALTTVNGAGASSTPGFVWSDFSKISHSESTADWLNGWLTELPVSTLWSLRN